MSALFEQATILWYPLVQIAKYISRSKTGLQIFLLSRNAFSQEIAGPKSFPGVKDNYFLLGKRHLHLRHCS